MSSSLNIELRQTRRPVRAVVRPPLHRTKWQNYPNDDIRSLHVDEELWDSIEAEYREVELTAKQQALADALNEILGVVAVGFTKYEIRITKGVVFGWDEIAPRIEAIFRQWADA